jgi:hypothetical protein
MEHLRVEGYLTMPFNDQFCSYIQFVQILLSSNG